MIELYKEAAVLSFTQNSCINVALKKGEQFGLTQILKQ